MDRSRTAQPRHWFNEQRNPTFDFGLFALPAYILPVLLASVFIWTRPHRRFLQRLNRNPAEINQAVLNGVRNDRAGDFPRQLQGLLALFHVFCTGPALTQSIGSNKYKDDLFGYGSAEALSLLVGGFYLDPAMLTTYLAASTGWILLATDTRFSNAAALLSLPCAWQVLGHTGIYHWQSGSLLFVLALDYAGFDFVHYMPEVAVNYLKPWSLTMYTSCLLIGGTLNILRSAARRESLRESVDTILAELNDTYREVKRLAVHLSAFLGPVALNGAITGFLTACIGWRSVVFGNPVNAPFSSSLAPKLGFFLFYLPLWCMVQLLTDSRDRRERRDMMETFLSEMVICADVTGLAAILMVLLWWAALVLPHLHAIIYQ